MWTWQDPLSKGRLTLPPGAVYPLYLSREKRYSYSMEKEGK